MKSENCNNEYHHSAHLVYLCRYDIVFCPKYRRKILKNGLDDFVKETFRQIADKYQFTIVEMEVMPDHVHLLIDCDPRYGITNCVKVLKHYSVTPMRQFDPTLNTRMPSIWTKNSFIASVGSTSPDAVKQYIENQKKEHQKCPLS